MKKLFLLLLSALAFGGKAQVKLGTNPTKNPDAIFEMESAAKGMLITSVALTAVSNPAPLGAFTAGMLVYNTATAATGKDKVTPGFYFSDGTQWLKANTSGIENSVDVSGLGANLGSPNSFGGAVFSPNTPGTTGVIYINNADGTAWVYNGTQYESYQASPIASWYLAGGTTDAGANKISNIYRPSAVGIGSNNTPDASSLLDLNGTGKGFLVPRLTQVQMNAISQPAQALELYCTDCTPKGMYINNGTAALPAWSSLASSVSPAIVSDCSLNGFAGGYYNGVALTAANTFSVTITNNTFGDATLSFAPSDLVLSGVSGITVASVSPASFNYTAGATQKITYTLSGTPASLGTLTATWAKATLNCVKTQAVTTPAAVGALSCGLGTTTGAVNYFVTTSGVSFSIPYTGGNGGTYLTQTVTSTGVTNLTATLAAGGINNGSGNLVYTVTGTPFSTGAANFALNFGGQSCTFAIIVNSLGTGGTSLVSSWTCATASAGALQAGIPVSGVTQTITGNVALIGTYNISLPAVNGVTFSGSGTFAATGSQAVILTASGTPAASGNTTFALPTTPTCSFSRVINPAATFNCAGIIQNITPALPLVNGTAYSGTVTISYTAGNGVSYGATVLGPVSGLTITAVPGTYAAGGGNVVYNISGTYSGVSGGGVAFTGLPECTSGVVLGDAIRGGLSKGGCTSCAAYDAAATDSYVQVSQAEYDSLTNVVTGITNYGMKPADRSKSPGLSGAVNWMYSNNIPTTAIPFAFSTKMSSSAGCVKLIKQNNTIGAVTSVDWNSATGISIAAGGGNTTYYFVIKKPTIYMPANTNIAVHGYPSLGGSGGSGVDGVTSSSSSFTSATANETNCTLGVGTVSSIAAAGTPSATLYFNYDIKWTTTRQW